MWLLLALSFAIVRAGVLSPRLDHATPVVSQGDGYSDSLPSASFTCDLSWIEKELDKNPRRAEQLKRIITASPWTYGGPIGRAFEYYSRQPDSKLKKNEPWVFARTLVRRRLQWNPHSSAKWWHRFRCIERKIIFLKRESPDRSSQELGVFYHSIEEQIAASKRDLLSMAARAKKSDIDAIPGGDDGLFSFVHSIWLMSRHLSSESSFIPDPSFDNKARRMSELHFKLMRKKNAPSESAEFNKLQAFFRSRTHQLFIRFKLLVLVQAKASLRLAKERLKAARPPPVIERMSRAVAHAEKNVQSSAFSLRYVIFRDWRVLMPAYQQVYHTVIGSTINALGILAFGGILVLSICVWRVVRLTHLGYAIMLGLMMVAAAFRVPFSFVDVVEASWRLRTVCVAVLPRLASVAQLVALLMLSWKWSELADELMNMDERAWKIARVGVVVFVALTSAFMFVSGVVVSVALVGAADHPERGIQYNVTQWDYSPLIGAIVQLLLTSGLVAMCVFVLRHRVIQKLTMEEKGALRQLAVAALVLALGSAFGVMHECAQRFASHQFEFVPLFLAWFLVYGAMAFTTFVYFFRSRELFGGKQRQDSLLRDEKHEEELDEDLSNGPSPYERY